jgi:putative phosphoesterase
MLTRAVATGNEHGCSVLLFAGDLICPIGIEILSQFSGEVHMVLGNNEGELVKLTRLADATPRITLHGNLNGGTMEHEFGGLRFYMNHYPGNAENAALSGKYDVVIFGHTHKYHEERTANGVLLLNPGEVEGYRTGSSTAMILDTETKLVERIPLSV